MRAAVGKWRRPSTIREHELCCSCSFMRSAVSAPTRPLKLRPPNQVVEPARAANPGRADDLERRGFALRTLPLWHSDSLSRVTDTGDWPGRRVPRARPRRRSSVRHAARANPQKMRPARCSVWARRTFVHVPMRPDHRRRFEDATRRVDASLAQCGARAGIAASRHASSNAHPFVLVELHMHRWTAQVL